MNILLVYMYIHIVFKARKEIRNIWAHRDFRVWDQMKFMQGFQIMTQIVKNLQLSPREETDTLG